jgi:hypothetical protein
VVGNLVAWLQQIGLIRRHAGLIVLVALVADGRGRGDPRR